MILSNNPDIIHEATNADLNNYYYFKIYASANTEVTINGVTLTLVAGTTLPLVVKSISSTANIFLIGYKKSVLTGSNIL